MKRIVIFLFALFTAAAAALAQTAPPYQWMEYKAAGFNPDNSKRPVMVFNSTVHPVGTCPGFDGTALQFSPCNFARGVWTTVTLAQFGVPADAGEIYVKGILIITPNQIAGTPDVWFMCRAPGSQLPAGSYNDQAIGQVTDVMGMNYGPLKVQVGARSSAGTFCPVKNGAVEFYWQSIGPGDSYYGLNLSLQAYYR